jgi:UDP-N-acetylglucosamine 2-epimerase (non-hydrolysing)
MRFLTIYGTRPEAIKLAPVVLALRADSQVQSAVCVTGQHREMLDQVNGLFGITPEYDLNLMKPGQDLTHVTTAVLEGLAGVLDHYQPDWVIVQGDTTTAFASALAAFYRKVRIAHVEAGLRTGNLHSPWPEEGNRKLITQLSNVHFAPTQNAADNLNHEGLPDKAIVITGNTVIDALHWVVNKIKNDTALAMQFDFLKSDKRLILVTGHRRESFDGGLANICRGLAQLAERDDIEIVYAVHMNPHVVSTVQSLLGRYGNVHLLPPQNYSSFVYLMQRCHFIITDSGGIQEEAPALGKPVLVTRETTERPEAIAAGTARLIGTVPQALVDHSSLLLDEPERYAAMAQARHPFGDGKAAQHIVAHLTSELRAAA